MESRNALPHITHVAKKDHFISVYLIFNNKNQPNVNTVICISCSKHTIYGTKQGQIYRISFEFPDAKHHGV